MILWLITLLIVVKATAIEPNYLPEAPKDASLVSSDPEYRIFEKNLVEWREVKVIGHWFWMRLANSRKMKLVVPTFYHTLVAVAEEENYNGESGTGSRGKLQ